MGDLRRGRSRIDLQGSGTGVEIINLSRSDVLLIVEDLHDAKSNATQKTLKYHLVNC